MTASQSSACLDFKFAWRWLLRGRVDGIRVWLGGFSDEECRYWSTATPCLAVEKDPSLAEAWIIAADHFSGAVPASDQLRKLRLLCIVGRQRAARPWRRAVSKAGWMRQEFALIPASRPRLVVPLNSNRDAAAALVMHRPGRWYARMAVHVLRWLARGGVLWPMRRNTLMLAFPPERQSAPRVPELAGPAIQPDANTALYLGAEGGARKTVVLPIREGRADIIMKVGESPMARAALRREAGALSELARSPLAAHIPALRGGHDGSRETILWETYRPRRLAPRLDLRPDAAEFLATLSRIERRRVAISDLLPRNAEFPQLSDAGRADVRQALQGTGADITDASDVVVHRSHGDFAPWNCAWSGSGLFVFDWEDSRPDALAFEDAFYFVVAPAAHVYRDRSPACITTSALRFASDVAGRSGLAAEDLRMYWVLWLIGRLRSKPHPLYLSLLRVAANQRHG